MEGKLGPVHQMQSEAARRWDRQKARGVQSMAIDALMEYEGLEEVKMHFLNILCSAHLTRLQGGSPKCGHYNAVFQGNPGTGKTSVARLYNDLLVSLQMVPEYSFVETSGVELASKGVEALRSNVQFLLDVDEEGGVLFIDESYQMLSDHQGRQVLDLILKRMSDKSDKLVVIFVGYKKQMEPLFEYNQGLESRIDYRFHFSNFTTDELRRIFIRHVRKEYAKMQFEGNDDGIYVQIAMRRLWRASDSPSFGNARAVQTCARKMIRRQHLRLSGQDLLINGNTPQDEYDSPVSQDSSITAQYHILTRNDIIGPPPEKAFDSQAWTQLQGLVGLKEVKRSVQALIESLAFNYNRECKNETVLDFPLNRVLVGQPGTGKTTVARLYGQILADIGLLSRGDVVLKTPADFIGSHVGSSEEKTRNILEATLGKVLIIDEAYMLDAGNDGNTTNSFKASVVDTIVANVQGGCNEDRCILLLGYEDKMNSLFKNMNPGLSRRFQADRPWRFANYDLSEMKEILERRMMQDDLKCTDDAFETACDMLKRASTRPDFANAAEIDHCLKVAEINYIQRLSKPSPSQQFAGKSLLPEDFDPDLEQRRKPLADEIFRNVSNKIANQLIAYEQTGRRAIERGLKNPYLTLPHLLAFKGSPGTGRKTTARFLGRIYYNLGYISSEDVVLHTGLDFIGRYVGQTAPKTKDLLDRSLGKVLLIDDANSLNQDSYGTEALRELIQFISELSYPKTMVIILADSVQKMNILFKDQPSLKAHFKEEIMFEDLLPNDCISLLRRELEAQSVTVPELQEQHPINLSMKELETVIQKLQLIPGFQNAGDMIYVAQRVMAKSLGPGTELRDHPSGHGFEVSVQLITSCVHEIVEERRRQFIVTLRTRPDGPSWKRGFRRPKKNRPSRGTEAESPQAAAIPAHQQVDTTAEMQQRQLNSRSGSSSDVTARDTSNIGTQETAETVRAGVERTVLKRKQETREELNPKKACTSRALDQQQQHVEREEGVEEAVWKQLEIDKKNALKGKELERNKEKERQIQERLKALGKCIYGYDWIKQEEGYRCAGGSHFVSNNSLGDLM